MKVKVHSIHFEADKKLLNFIQKKVNKLDTFYDCIIDGEVYLRKEDKVTEIKLNLPGNNPFAKKHCKTFEEATDTALEALRRQIKKQKEIMRTMTT